MQNAFIILLIFSAIGIGMALTVYIYPVNVVKKLEKQMQDLIENLHRSHEESERMRIAAQNAEKRYHDLIQGINAIVWEVDLSTWKLLFVSRQVEKVLGYPYEQWLTVPDFWHQHLHPDDRGKFLEDRKRNLLQGENPSIDYRVINAEGQTVWFHDILHVIKEEGQPKYLQGVTLDFTERKRVEEERERLIHELEKALAQVKRLSGLLPICASCKKVRDDKGYWTQIEAYIRDHSEAQFSHGICPDCRKKLYPDFDFDRLTK